MLEQAINYTALRLLWDVLQSAALVGLFVWTVIDRKRQLNSDGIAALKYDQQKITQRVQRLEDAVVNLPSAKEMTALKVQMASLTTQVTGMDRKLDTIHHFLLNNNRSKEDGA